MIEIIKALKLTINLTYDILNITTNLALIFNKDKIIIFLKRQSISDVHTWREKKQIGY